MRLASFLSVLGLLTVGSGLAMAESDFSGTYFASLPERAEILQLHRDGTAEITLSDEVTAGAGGFTFSDSFGSWKVSGPRTLTARFLNLNFDVTGPAAFTGIAVVDYTFEFEPTFHAMKASCNGKIFPSGQDPFAPGSTPYVEFDCAYLNGHLYQRMPL
jgi:hypothetical protein